MRFSIFTLLGVFFVSTNLFAAEIMAPEVYDITRQDYAQFRKKAAEQIDDTKNECAKFVNRIFQARFKKNIWGNAWDIQINDQNLKYLSLEWQLPESEFLRHKNFQLKTPQDRIKHFEELYKTIENKPHRIGVIGFMYRYSAAKDFLVPGVLPQTHISFLAGEKIFSITNTTQQTVTIRQLLEDQYGKIHDFEAAFVNSRLNQAKNWVEKRYSLDSKIKPGASFFYHDYLIEEQFQFVRSDSLLGIFLRKHRNNHISALLRPVSFSRITPAVWLTQPEYK